jgi:hypothetical protein
MTLLEQQLWDFEARIDEAAALDAAEAHAKQIKAEDLRNTLAGRRELGDSMYPKLADLVSEFSGYGGEEKTARFHAAAAKALFEKAQAGDAEAAACIGDLEEFFLRSAG